MPASPTISEILQYLRIEHPDPAIVWSEIWPVGPFDDHALRLYYWDFDWMSIQHRYFVRVVNDVHDGQDEWWLAEKLESDGTYTPITGHFGNFGVLEDAIERHVQYYCSNQRRLIAQIQRAQCHVHYELDANFADNSILLNGMTFPGTEGETTPEFLTEVYSHSEKIKITTVLSQITMRANTLHAYSTILWEGMAANPLFSKNLVLGKNTASFEIVSADGSARRTVEVEITRTEPATD